MGGFNSNASALRLLAQSKARYLEEGMKDKYQAALEALRADIEAKDYTLTPISE